MNNRFMVYVRVNPSLDKQSIIDVVDDKTLIFDPLDTDKQFREVPVDHAKQQRSLGTKKGKNSCYTFDGIFDDRSTNYNIFETVTRPMVDGFIDGFNSSVFVYGSTGSGNTHTMLWKPHNLGVIHHTIKDLFEKVAVINEQFPLAADLKICYFEIYNEKIFDLLGSKPNTIINYGNERLRTTPQSRRTGQQGTPRDANNLSVCELPGDDSSLVIPGLTFHKPDTADQLIRLLEAGNANRSQHSTDANADSSRSHSIFQIILTRQIQRSNENNDPAGFNHHTQTSKLSFIDLAGSERASGAYRPGNQRTNRRQQEGANINKSLLALGNCIEALADPSRGRHIPFRDSKLTRLLKDSLDGRCRIAMIATINQDVTYYDDIQSTLNYVARMKPFNSSPGRPLKHIAEQHLDCQKILKCLNEQISCLQLQNKTLISMMEQYKQDMETLQKEVRGLEKPTPKSTIQTDKSPKPVETTQTHMMSRAWLKNLSSTFRWVVYLTLEMNHNVL